MKKYVMFTLAITGIGGGQIYVSNKLKYMSSLGYETYVFSACQGDIQINYLKSIKSSIDTRLILYPSGFSFREANSIVDALVEFIHYTECDDVLLESTCVNLSLWAELMAEKCNAKHFLFSISESNEIFPASVDYFEFKYKRRELFTINENTFLRLYNKSTFIYKGSIPVLSACLGEPVEDYHCPKLDEVDKKDITICILGRLSKRYMEIAARELAVFCQKNSGLSFNVLVVGGVQSQGDLEAIEKIRQYFRTIHNVYLYETGALSPLPERLFEICDLFIGGAGCATLPYRKGKLTLGMSVIDGNALGLMGYHIIQTFNLCGVSADMQGLLYDALISKDYLKMRYTPFSVAWQNIGSLDDHIKEYGKSSEKNEYYPTLKIKFPIKKRLGMFLIRSLGVKKTRLLLGKTTHERKNISNI